MGIAASNFLYAISVNRRGRSRKKTNINNREPEQWPYSVILLGSMAVFLVLGFGVGIGTPLFTSIYRNSLQTLMIGLK